MGFFDPWNDCISTQPNVFNLLQYVLIFGFIIGSFYYFYNKYYDNKCETRK